MDDLVSEFDAEVYRFVQPKYTSVADMFAGKGPLYANGRWLAKGTQLAIYTALAPEVALAEALAATRYYGFPDSRAAPLVFVTAQAKLKKVIDLRNGSIRQRLRLSNPDRVMSLPLQSRSLSKLQQEHTVTFSIRPKESD